MRVLVKLPLQNHDAKVRKSCSNRKERTAGPVSRVHWDGITWGSNHRPNRLVAVPRRQGSGVTEATKCCDGTITVEEEKSKEVEIEYETAELIMLMAVCCEFGGLFFLCSVRNDFIE